MNAFCASENFDAFIALRSFPASGNNRKTLARNDPVFRVQSKIIEILRLHQAEAKPADLCW
jgi:hypothetical protein